jgi:mono/diheme cytochrome c family protein
VKEFPPRLKEGGQVIVKLSNDSLKKLAIALIILPLLSVILLGPTLAGRAAATDDFDAATTFKTKCAMCHGADASKKFDATKADDALVETVMKGKDAAPIKMPSYEAKGMTAEQAKTLVTLMKSLKK